MELIAETVKEAIRQKMNCSDGLEIGYKPIDPIEIMNSGVGTLSGFDCDKCRNKGVIYFRDEYGYELFRDCECMKARKSRRMLERSGLKNLIAKCTFDNFKTEEDFQKLLKNKALDYLNCPTGHWYFAGGQVGCGKTHICTALVSGFLDRGKPARYMQWRDEIVKIKANANSDNYPEITKIWKQIEVLYIDDLFKTERDKRPTTADINVAFEILNYRYQNPELVTIISSERTISEIIAIDEGVGSRIYEMSRGYCTNVNNDISKNYRLKSVW